MFMKRILSAGIIFLFFTTCAKTSLQCEKWEVKYENFSLNGCLDLSCAGSRTMQLNFCGDALKNAGVGNTEIISEDQCCKKTMTYMRLIK